ncbi:hypothetical protein AB0K67_36805 [Nonomuraea sp. NPDC052634]|uniref:hypothetical protein n=1 Tax=Nonomuraea sp. NPDC052634 TaxID=3155813 RepID=UPI003412D57C
MEEAEMCEDSGNVHWLGGPGSLQPATVGAEMAAISSLHGEFVVPAGFCLPMTFCPRWDDTAGLEAVLRAAVSRFPRGDAGSAPSLRVRASVGLDQRAPRMRLPRAPSFHNVGEDALVEAVMESAAPFLSARRRGQVEPGCVPSRVVVVVQRFERPRAWISASFDPEAAGRVVVLRAGWGLREDDDVADLLVIDGATRAVVGGQVADKRRMTIDAEGGGVRETEVQAELRETPCLDGRTAREIASRTLELVSVLPTPVRLELELTKGRLHLLGVPSLNAATES